MSKTQRDCRLPLTLEQAIDYALVVADELLRLEAQRTTDAIDV